MNCDVRDEDSQNADSAPDAEAINGAIDRFKHGLITADQFRSIRVPYGIYEQREPGTFMVRVRLTAGVIHPDQMRRLAQVAAEHANGMLHVTTRQDVQVHGLRLDGIVLVLRALHGAGLSTKGSGGNTVRNVATCAGAGACHGGAFDVSPWATALTGHMVPDAGSYDLPRKFKIAFSGCARDCAGSTISDVGFIATKRGNVEGFSVYVGGGLGAHSRVGDRLEDFVPAGACYRVAEAVKRVFARHGDREHRNRARLRFLLAGIGLGAFRTLYAHELAELKEAGAEVLKPFPSSSLQFAPKASRLADALPADGFEAWQGLNVNPQEDSAFSLVSIPLPLGDITSATLTRLADIVETHGERTIRTTNRQDMLLRRVAPDERVTLHRKLAEIGLADATPAVSRDIVACAGPSTCRMGICMSRGLAKAVTDALNGCGFELSEARDLAINISGCPNACGRHPAAAIGCFGATRRIDGRQVPHYVIQLGGHLEEGKTRLARGHLAVPAKNTPAFLVDLLKAFRHSAEYADFEAFLETAGEDFPARLASNHTSVPPFEKDARCYCDWGSAEPFSLTGRGPGECGAA